MPEGTSDRLTVADAFGPAAPVLRGMSIDVGDRLTGWVAASRQPIVNSDAALDLRSRMHAISPLRSCMSVPIAIGPSLVAALARSAGGTLLGRRGAGTVKRVKAAMLHRSARR